MMMRRLPLLVAAIAVLAIAGPASAATESVSVVDNSFDPGSVTIRAGDTVHWTNNGSNPHTVTGNGFESGTIAAGDDYSHTFDSAGTFDYVCDFHPGMDGTVVVRAAATGSGDVDDDTDDDEAADDEVSGDELARTGSSRAGTRLAFAVAMVALGAWLIDAERIRSARHRSR